MVHEAEILTENKSLLFQWRHRYDHEDAFPGLERLTWGSTQVAEEHCRFFSLPYFTVPRKIAFPCTGNVYFMFYE